MKNQLSAIRTLSRFRTYTMINIIGLAVSVSYTDNCTLYPSGDNS